jgi:hypothetical protein
MDRPAFRHPCIQQAVVDVAPELWSFQALGAMLFSVAKDLSTTKSYWYLCRGKNGDFDGNENLRNGKSFTP